jgi:hypothetical protein
MKIHNLTIRQQVWLAAWTAAIQSAKYNPSEEAKACLDAFDAEFGESNKNIKLVSIQNDKIPPVDYEDDK